MGADDQVQQRSISVGGAVRYSGVNFDCHTVGLAVHVIQFKDRGEVISITSYVSRHLRVDANVRLSAITAIVTNDAEAPDSRIVIH